MHAVFETEIGAFTMALDTENAPVTAGYFEAIIQSGAMNGAVFFRIVGPENASLRADNPIEVVQGGLREADLQPVAAIRHEPTSETCLSHKKWAVSTARNAPGETYGSFFICMRDEPELDWGGKRHPDGLGFAVFGSVVDGFDVVDALFRRREGQEFMDEPILIVSAKLVEQER
ncbi:MAG: peptidylprolyl isomerase [Pseudomonadota bacterium]